MYKSRFIDGTDATEYQEAISPILSEIADVVSEADEPDIADLPLEWNDLWVAMDETPHRWIHTTNEMFNSMLEAVPPIDLCQSGFLVGEAQYHNATNEPVYACFVVHPGKPERYLARYMTRREFVAWRSIRA